MSARRVIERNAMKRDLGYDGIRVAWQERMAKRREAAEKANRERQKRAKDQRSSG